MAEDINIRIGAKNQASRVLSTVGRDVDRFSSRVTSKSKAIINAFTGMRAAVVGFGAAVAASSAFRQISTQLDRIDEVSKTSRKLGILADDLIGIRMAAAEMSGMMSGQVDMALQRMTRRISEAANGTGEAKAAIEELGLTAMALNNAGPARAFSQIADAIRKVQNPADRLRIAFKLFDSEGAALVNTLNGGSKAIDEMKVKAQALGLTFDKLEGEQIERTNDAIHEMKMAWRGLVTELTIAVAPALEQQAKGLREILFLIQNINTTTGQGTVGLGGSLVRPGLFNQPPAATSSANSPQAVAQRARRQYDVSNILKKRMQERFKKEALAIFGIDPNKKQRGPAPDDSFFATDARLLVRGKGASVEKKILDENIKQNDWLEKLEGYERARQAKELDSDILQLEHIE